MERKVGEKFIYKDKTYQVVKSFGCIGCDFADEYYTKLHIIGKCGGSSRLDKTSVVFKEINNMENNQLTIYIPEEMEIDLENSNLAKGIIKFKKKDITFKNIYKDSNTEYARDLVIRKESEIGNKLLCIATLMDIAKYYNREWKPDWSKQDEYKYHILYNNNEDIYIVDYNNTFTISNIYFKNKEDAIAVINNPNFKNILNTIYKN